MDRLCTVRTNMLTIILVGYLKFLVFSYASGCANTDQSYTGDVPYASPKNQEL